MVYEGLGRTLLMKLPFYYDLVYPVQLVNMMKQGCMIALSMSSGRCLLLFLHARSLVVF